MQLASGGAANLAPAAATAGQVAYAGFWRRVAAFLLDGILITVALGILGGPFGVWRGWAPRHPISLGSMGLFGGLTQTVVTWLYFALLESSTFQATLGKQVIGIVVTDLYGRRVSFARATGRHFGKILSAITLGVGFAMSGFTARRQALHDMLAECVVIRKT
ncbi:MAG: RDD family protein [Thermoanaerobaculia bacterium]